MEALKTTPKRHRDREFSQIRGDHSNRSNISKSQIEQSRSNIGMSAFTYEGDKSQRRNQRRTTQNNNRSYQDTKTENHDKALCVDCFNKQYSKAQKEKRRRQMQDKKLGSKSYLIDEEDKNHQIARSRYTREYEDAINYNLSAMKRHQQEKQRQKAERERKNQLIYQQQRQTMKIASEKEAHIIQRRQYLKRQLQEQIKNAKIKKQKGQREKNQPIQPIFGEPLREILQKQKQENYKYELRHQIEQNKQRKQQQQEKERQRKYDQQLQLLSMASERKRIQQQEAERRKKLQMVEAAKRKQIQQQRRREEMQKKIQAEIQRQNENTKLTEEWQIKQENRRNQIERYLGDLKKQMEFNRKKKQREYTPNADRSQQLPSYFEKPNNVLERACDSCEKRYPEMYMTKVPDHLEL